MEINKASYNRDDSIAEWSKIPESFHYLRPWASKYGLRGLTVYHGRLPALSNLASHDELLELRLAYKEISEHGDGPQITQWCLSIPSNSPLSETKERIRGLLLLFERLAEYGLSPFNNGQVRYISPHSAAFNWDALPPNLGIWKPWLKRFQDLRTEHDLLEHVENADKTQLRELRELCDFMSKFGAELSKWCEQTNKKGNPASDEAFQAEWLFLLCDFARSRINA
jgi:hypothetical protein